MPQRTYAVDERPVPATTLTQVFLDAVSAYGNAPAFGRILPSMEVEYVSYNQVLDQARRVAGALRAQGISHGERVGIMSPNRLEWALADFGCLCSGVVDVPIYPTLTGDQVAYILRDSGARLIFVPDEDHMEKAVTAVAAFVPCAETGIKHTSRP